ncbi:hypothetical protein DL237_02735 [Pseudooceanicola sediminis]|uniref:YdhG-like domain-containing protein n=1 Tax=Pseudooceanicola sediminis TaxID=2211117 RepID=A0A399J4S6_9RHOB|nr:YdeI/OmpD-associated family protein [Pseudooceanicola sediminis]KAA2315546.1 hypothetical protein E0K93_06760 [Puniceibacterium sp. HSS470]RII40250.1 hypothetical protein DL237_02735 [Pseudooceanicola sediminis]|tara:strand:- start:41930 stop:42550 length:621 start_codon:yes stop_codon:yes gene_type:complete
MITDIETFFHQGCGRCSRFATPECSVHLWENGLSDLRRICCAAGLIETVKWGHPCYVHEGRNIVIIGAFRRHFCLSFFNAALMKDPAGVMVRQGPNTDHPNLISFDDAAQVAAQEGLILSYLKEAMGYAEAGIKPEKVQAALDYPDELVEALEGDAELDEAFRALTPGRQRSYVINLNGAKQSATRVARIAKFRDKILAGKGASER